MKDLIKDLKFIITASNDSEKDNKIEQLILDYIKQVENEKQLFVHGVVHPLPSKDEMTLELNTMLTELNKDVKPSYLKRSVLKGVEIGFKKCYEYVTGNCA